MHFLSFFHLRLIACFGWTLLLLFTSSQPICPSPGRSSLHCFPFHDFLSLLYLFPPITVFVLLSSVQPPPMFIFSPCLTPSTVLHLFLPNNHHICSSSHTCLCLVDLLPSDFLNPHLLLFMLLISSRSFLYISYVPSFTLRYFHFLSFSLYFIAFPSLPLLFLGC